MVKKKVFSVGLIGITLAVGLSLSACANSAATLKNTSVVAKSIDVIPAPYYILGPVTLRENAFGFLGITLPAMQFFGGEFPGFEVYLFRTGSGIAYVDLLAEARKTYGDADAIIDINYDYTQGHFFFLWVRRKFIASGLAIKYTRELVTNTAP